MLVNGRYVDHLRREFIHGDMDLDTFEALIGRELERPDDDYAHTYKVREI